MKKLTKIEIIDETVNYYSEDINRRSIKTITAFDQTINTCVYNGTNKTHCAVGRCLLDKYKKRGSKLPGNDLDMCVLTEILTGVEFDYFDYNIDKILSPKYRGHDVNFWCSLQTLHDKEGNWSDSGLTERGKEYVNRLKLLYGTKNK